MDEKEIERNISIVKGIIYRSSRDFKGHKKDARLKRAGRLKRCRKCLAVFDIDEMFSKPVGKARRQMSHYCLPCAKKIGLI